MILLYGSYGIHWSIIHVLFQNHSGYAIIPNVMSRYRGTEISPKAQCLKRFFSATLRVYDTVYQVSMATKQHEPKHPRDIIDILDNGRYLEATNPLDRVYAFYGIFRTLGYEEEQWLPLVYYSKSISILYRDFVVAYMSRFQRTVSGEGHLNGKNPPPKEASMRIRLLIYTNTPIQINS